MTMPRIVISSTHKQLLAEKFKVTRVAVQNALNYYSNSENAQAIRKDAIELLKREAAKAAVTINQ